MNDHQHIRSLAGVILIVLFVLSACAPAAVPTLVPIAPTQAVAPATMVSSPTSIPAVSTLTPAPIPATSIPTLTPIPPTSTLTPVAVSRLSKSPELILAINKPSRNTKTPGNVFYGLPEMDKYLPGNVVYKLPEMEKVLLASELTYYKNLTVDIYYPPNYQFKTKLPIIIIPHGFEELPDGADKDMPQHMDWAKLLAASGMIAISAQAGFDPMDNSYRVLDFLAANADFLGLDLNRIGFWASSFHGAPVFKAFQDKDLPYRKGFKAAAFLYLEYNKSTDPGIWPEGISLFVVKAGKDRWISASMMDNFVAQARSNKIPIEYIELPDALHAFDVTDNTQASKDTIQKVLNFFKSKLLT
jgi:dienelactone hydrolase